MIRKWINVALIFAIFATSFGFATTDALAQTSYVQYKVQSGDTLGKIAYRYCTDWKTIYDINRETIGKNPNYVQAGWVLTIPANCDREGTGANNNDKGPNTNASGFFQAPYYTVAWGDTLFSIGQRFGIAWQDIAAANGIEGTLVYAGETLLIPDGTTGIIPVPEQKPAERVSFKTGSDSDSRSGIINQGVPKSYILWAASGQTITVKTKSHGEPLVISIGNTRGDLLPITGKNSEIKNNVTITLPESGDYIVTVRPVTLPENPQLAFDITFIIP